jgi:hypothetical protein
VAGDTGIVRSNSTLVVGGAFRREGGKILVQKRSWEMLRLFTDHMSNPIFGMAEQPGNSTFGHELLENLEIIRIPSGTKVVDTWLNRRLTDELRSIIDNCYAVYLRLPLWSCWDVFMYARSKRKKIITSYHGDWTETYRKRQVNLPKRCILLRYFLLVRT